MLNLVEDACFSLEESLRLFDNRRILIGHSEFLDNARLIKALLIQREVGPTKAPLSEKMFYSIPLPKENIGFNHGTYLNTPKPKGGYRMSRCTNLMYRF